MASKQGERITCASYGSECKIIVLSIVEKSIDQHLSLFSFRTDDIRNTNEGLGTCGWILVALSYFLCALTFPFSLCVTVKVNKIRRETIFLCRSSFHFLFFIFRSFKNMNELLLCVWVEFYQVRENVH